MKKPSLGTSKTSSSKQFWRLLKSPNSLISCILQAKYFPNCSILGAGLGHRPSFIWRSILGVRDLVKSGARWLIGNGHNILVWSNLWRPRPYSFKPVHTSTTLNPSWKVADLIDYNLGSWKESVVKASFIPCDAKLILSISLCPVWPNETLIELTVRSAYHLARSLKSLEAASSSAPEATNHWSKL
ncbi:hypothetical protein Cgig2_013385 [Carnegiea gigantea]|uniref:Uncharacterized protein n=1 Tax=Carnegiea gigantea TaxID=171969 RepID=A0A9Q1K7Y4_9CARY|nr:hypothetical protein Cgig2_013385 [Carnegiea gigantea]